MPGLTPPRGTNAPAPPAGLAGPAPAPAPEAAPAPPAPDSQGGLEQDVNQDGVVDEQDVMILEDFVKMLKSMIKKKSTNGLGAGPQDVLNSPSAVQSAELLNPKFEAPTPPFLEQ